MNDPSELKYGLQLASEMIRARQTTARMDSGLWVVLDHLGQAMEGFASRSDFGMGQFLLSFSRESDNLPLWQSYADGGRAYALGMDCAAFQEISNPPKTDIHTSSMSYDYLKNRPDLNYAIDLATKISGGP